MCSASIIGWLRPQAYFRLGGYMGLFMGSIVLSYLSWHFFSMSNKSMDPMQGKVRFRLQQLFKIPRKLRLKKRFRIDAYEKLSVSKTGKNVRCQVVRLKAKSWCQASSCPGQAWRLRCHKNISSTTVQRKIVQPLGTSCSHSENHNSRRLKEILYIQVVFPHSIIDKIGFLQDLRVSRYTRRQRNSNGALYTRTKRPINQRIVTGTQSSKQHSIGTFCGSREMLR